MNDKITVLTNHHERPVLNWLELSDKERAEFDYLNTEQEREEAEFVRYKGEVYDLHDGFEPPPQALNSWSGYRPDSYFSGLVLRYPKDDGEIVFEYVVVGTYFVS